MNPAIKITLSLTWAIVLIVWIITGFFAKKVQSQEGRLSRFAQYWLPLLVAIYLLGPGEWFGHTWLRQNFVEHSNLVGIIALCFCIPGGIIAVWSRVQLGRNWSLSVQQKEDHELIQTGIYGVVRHPIYTGLLLLFVGNALIVGDYRAIIAVIIVFVSLWFKLKKEEKVLIETFGEQYRDYRKRTSALIPFLL